MNQQQFNQAVKDKFDSTFYEHPVSEEWYAAALKALDYASPFSMGITGLEMEEIEKALQDEAQLTYAQMGVLSNNLISRAPRDIPGISREGYYRLMKESDQIAYHFNKLVDETQQELASKMQSKPMVGIKGEA